MIVEVITTGICTGGSQDFEDAVIDGEEVGVKGYTTEIVGDGGSGMLVDDAKGLETGNGVGIPGGLTLGVVEAGGDGDKGMGGLLFQGKLQRSPSSSRPRRGFFLGVKSRFSPRCSNAIAGFPFF
jgi:hypothetical protein